MRSEAAILPTAAVLALNGASLVKNVAEQANGELVPLPVSEIVEAEAFGRYWCIGVADIALLIHKSAIS